MFSFLSWRQSAVQSRRRTLSSLWTHGGEPFSNSWPLGGGGGEASPHPTSTVLLLSPVVLLVNRTSDLPHLEGASPPPSGGPVCWGTFLMLPCFHVGEWPGSRVWEGTCPFLIMPQHHYVVRGGQQLCPVSPTLVKVPGLALGSMGKQCCRSRSESERIRAFFAESKSKIIVPDLDLDPVLDRVI
jgi:hypothetical protein